MAVSEHDRQHFQSIAAGVARLNQESMVREQELTPGERIEAALRLTDQFLRSTPMEEKPPPVSLAHRSAIRCDLLMLMFKRRLNRFVATLTPSKLAQLDKALATALDLPPPTP